MFDLVGRESKHARHAQIFTFPGTQAFHNLFNNFSPLVLIEEGEAFASSPAEEMIHGKHSGLRTSHCVPNAKCVDPQPNAY